MLRCCPNYSTEMIQFKLKVHNFDNVYSPKLEERAEKLLALGVQTHRLCLPSLHEELTPQNKGFHCLVYKNWPKLASNMKLSLLNRETQSLSTAIIVQTKAFAVI